MTPGTQLVIAERDRQIETEGFSIENDLKKYGSNEDLLDYSKYLLTGDRGYFPAGWDQEWMQKKNKKTKKENIVRAAACLIAYIDVLEAKKK